MEQDLTVWIGLANVSIDTNKDIFGTKSNAYVTVLSLADDNLDFEAQVNIALINMGLHLLEIEENEPFLERLEKFEVTSEILELAEIVKETSQVQFATFHAYDL